MKGTTILGRVLLGSLSFLAYTSAVFAQTPLCKPSIDTSRSLVITDGALDKTRFSFAKTLDAILGSLGIAKTPENRESFLRSMLTSFNAAQLVNPVSGLRMAVEIRKNESLLDPKKLLDPVDPIGLLPIALFKSPRSPAARLV
jgi:hypothetical protein